MVLLVDKFTKLYSKLENHHHHHHRHHDHDDHQRLEEALSGFRSDILFSLNQFLANWNPVRSESLSLPRIQQSLELIPIVNQAFAKLAVDIDHPMRKWEAASVEEYLNYTFHILNLLNSITSSLSQLGQARLSLSHALGLLKNSPSLALHHLKGVKLKNSGSAKDFKRPENENKASSEETSVSWSGKERIIHQALVELKSIGFWVCGIVLSGLHREAAPYLEIRKLADGFTNSSVIGLDSRVFHIVMGEGFVLEDVKDLNHAVVSLAEAITSGKQQSNVAEELRRKLELFGRVLEDVETRVYYIFSSTLARRNQLLGTLRKQSQQWEQEQIIFNHKK